MQTTAQRALHHLSTTLHFTVLFNILKREVGSRFMTKLEGVVLLVADPPQWKQKE